MISKKKALQITDALTKEYPDSTPALKYSSSYELLVAVILSAQCTDERVNKVTEALFKRANTPEAMAKLSQEELEKYIFSCGLYRSKAEHIISASKDIVEKFGGEVPSGLEDLRSLAGVGRKTANVVYSVAFGGDAIAVDTHVFRVSQRLGFAEGKTPLDTEKRLMEALPKEKWSHMHHAIIFHGRRVCSARSPKCDACVVSSLCKYYNSRKRG
ncbi:MAG: endonuclease III [Clostridia bacterium]|nr:endonuclease III [Clostridia bacterium]